MNAASSHILAADDDTLAREFLAEILRRMGHRVWCAEDGIEALDLLKKEAFPLVVTDLKMPGIGGMELLKETKRIHPDTEVIIATAFGRVDSAVEAVKLGAFDYVTKPFSRERIETLVSRALERFHLRREREQLKAQLERQRDDPTIVGRNPRMRAALEIADLSAETDATVLIRGETGTGKELIARYLHARSRRRDRPLVKVSCAALPETLLEAELFGHEKGAFTGAYQKRVGRFEKARGGTLFLDEIGDLSPSTQIRLLNVLQDRRFERLGSNDPIETDVRVLAATNRNLEELMKSGRFREDLYFRLKVVEIDLPPLRDRPEDLPLLAEHFLRQAAGRCGKTLPSLSRECLEAMSAHDWPGNVRELENQIERAVIVSSSGSIGVEDLTDDLARPGNGDPFRPAPVPTLAEGERGLIRRALDRTGWNRSSAARLLGIDRSTLLRKIKTYRLTPTRPPS